MARAGWLTLLFLIVACAHAYGDSAGPPTGRVPRAIAYTDNGYAAADGAYLVVSQPRHHAVLVYESTANTPRVLHAFGTYGKMAGQFVHPTGVAISVSRGLIYVSDTENNRVQAFRFDAARPEVAPSFVKAVGKLGAAAGEFDHPEGLAVDAAGNLYVGDVGNARVQVIDAEFHAVRTWGGLGTGDGQFDTPLSLAVDPQHARLYVADATNLRIQAFDLEGTFLFAWGNAAVPGQAVAGSLAYPFGLAVGDGHVYVTDCRRQVVVKFTSAGDVVMEWGGPPAAGGQLFQPAAVAVDNRGRVIVIDFGGTRGQMFSPDGVFLERFTIPAGDLAPKGTPAGS